MSGDVLDAAHDRVWEGLRRACGGEMRNVVITELIAALGETIGLAPYCDRPQLLTVVFTHLSQYVGEIPP